MLAKSIEEINRSISQMNVYEKL